MWCSQINYNLERSNRCRVQIVRVLKYRKALSDKIIRWDNKHLIISRWTKVHRRGIDWQKSIININDMTHNPRRTTWRWKVSQMRTITLSQILTPLNTPINSSSCIFKTRNHGEQELIKPLTLRPRIIISRQRWSLSSQKLEGLNLPPCSLRS